MQHIREKPAPGARIDFSHPLAKGLVGCWLMNETGQRVFDSSPYKNHGKLVGFDSPPKRGTYGIAFDGVDDYVDAGRPTSLNLMGNFAISVWMKTSTQTLMIPIDRYISEEGGYSLTIFTGGLVRNTIRNGVLISNLDDTVNIADGNWHNAVITYDGIKQYIYRDGKFSCSKNWTTNPGNQTNIKFNIGRRSELETEYSFNGSIDEVRIYNRALSSDEIKQLYINPYDMFKSKTTTYV